MTVAAKPVEERLSSRQSKPPVALTIVTSAATDATHATAEAAEASASQRLTTPKMKWMLRWSQQLEESEGPPAQGEAAGAAETTANATEAQVESVPQAMTEERRVQADEEGGNAGSLPHVADVEAIPVVVKTTATTGTEESRATATEDGEVVSDAEPGEVKAASRREPRSSYRNSGVTTDQDTTGSAELRVTMPPAVESSSLSPPMERASPTAASASISPSAKVKEMDGVVVRSRTPSPAKMMLDESVPSTVSSSAPDHPPVKPMVSSLLNRPEAGSEVHHNDPEPLERLPIKRKPQETPIANTLTSTPATEPTILLSESERQRLERRKRRKTNWDVGDPRKHGGSVDLAALNLLSSTSTPATHPASFAKFPRQRPAYRHSQSLDSKDPPFQRRASFSSGLSYSSPPAGPLSPAIVAALAQSPPVASSLPPVAPPAARRTLSHSNSMPPPSVRPGSSRYSANGGYR